VLNGVYEAMRPNQRRSYTLLFSISILPWIGEKSLIVSSLMEERKEEKKVKRMLLE